MSVLALVLFKPLFFVTDKNELLFLYLGSFMGAGTVKGYFGLGYGQKIMMEAGVYFKQEIQSNILL